MHLSGVEGPAGAVVEAAKLRRTHPSDCELLAVTGAHAGMKAPSSRQNLPGVAFYGRSFGGALMLLTRGEPLGYDSERMAFKFTMLNGDEPVQCQISGAAMDDLAGCKGTQPVDREAQFSRLRERIEHIASMMFDEKTALKGAVLRIFSKHIRK